MVTAVRFGLKTGERAVLALRQRMLLAVFLTDFSAALFANSMSTEGLHSRPKISIPSKHVACSNVFSAWPINPATSQVDLFRVWLTARLWVWKHSLGTLSLLGFNVSKFCNKMNPNKGNHFVRNQMCWMLFSHSLLVAQKHQDILPRDQLPRSLKRPSLPECRDWDLSHFFGFGPVLTC